MSITAVCTSCGKRFQAPAQFAGKRVKCKGCGVVFQIPPQPGSAAPAASSGSRVASSTQSRHGDQVDIDDSLAQLESVASFAGENVAQPSATKAGTSVGGKSKIIARNEVNSRRESNPDAEAVPLDGPSDMTYRANVLKFRYPGAKQIDQWLPLGLLILGLGMMAMVISPQQAGGVTWIAALRFFIPLLLYWVLILPMTMAMVHKAGQEMRYQMPPNPKLRGFAVYMPAFAFAVTFWLASNGSILGLILGAFIGLAISSGALWVLFRLRDEEIPTSIGYGAGGFTIGLGIAIALVLGMNFLTIVILNQTKSQAKVPASPFGPNLSWVASTTNTAANGPAKPKPGVTKNASPQATVQQAAAPKTGIDSAVLSDLQPSPVAVPNTGDTPTSTLIQPLAGSSVIAIATNENNQTTVEPWDLATGQRVAGEPLKVKGKPGKFAISTDGKSVAWIATFPRRSVQVWSFEDGKATTGVELDPSRGEADIIGFSAPDRLILRWGDLASPEMEVVNVKTQSRVALFKIRGLESKPPIFAINAATQRLLVAGRVGGTPTLIQFDLNDGQQLLYTKIVDLDPSFKVEPRGLAYSNDGKRMAIYIEHSEGALLVSYDTDGSQKPVSIVYPDGPTPGDVHEKFADNALASLDPSPCWLIYGDAVIDARTNEVLGNIGVKNVIAQRVLDGDRVELLTTDAANHLQLKIATVDRSKLKALTAPPPPQALAQP